MGMFALRTRCCTLKTSPRNNYNYEMSRNGGFISAFFDPTEHYIHVHTMLVRHPLRSRETKISWTDTRGDNICQTGRGTPSKTTAGIDPIHTKNESTAETAILC